MSSPIDRLSSSVSTSVDPAGVEASSTGPAPATPPQSSLHQVSAWTGVPDDGVHPFECDERLGAPAPPSYRRADLDAFAVLDAPLERLARQFPEGDASAFRTRDWQGSGFLSAAQDRGLNEAFAHLPREVVVRELEGRVQSKWAALPDADARALANELADTLAHGLRQRTAFTLRDAAVTMLRDGAKAFERTAGDREVLCDAVHQLAALERPTSSAAERLQAEHLREALGLDRDATQVRPEQLAEALRARAKLMRSEAWDLEGAGVETIYRRMAQHDVRAVVAREAGIAPGSWAAKQLDGVKAEGEAQQGRLDGLRAATVVVAAAATGGMALTGVAGVAATVSVASLSAMDAAVKLQAASGAKAGESAGTMAAGAASAARTRAAVAVVETVVVAGGAHGVASATHHSVAKLASRLGAETAVNAVAHGGVHFGVHQLATGAAHVVVPEAPLPQGSGRDGLSRLAALEER